MERSCVRRLCAWLKQTAAKPEGRGDKRGRRAAAKATNPLAASAVVRPRLILPIGYLIGPKRAQSSTHRVLELAHLTANASLSSEVGSPRGRPCPSFSSKRSDTERHNGRPHPLGERARR